jgi:hypothetical protein
MVGLLPLHLARRELARKFATGQQRTLRAPTLGCSHSGTAAPTSELAVELDVD